MSADGKLVILVTAGREIKDPKPMRRVLRCYVDKYGARNITLRQGAARGGDTVSKFVSRGLGITDIEDRPVEYYGLDWERDGKNAGNLRNECMLDEDPIPVIVLAFPDDSSRGTYNCVDAAIRRDIPVHMYFDYLSANNPKRAKYIFYQGTQ